MISDVAQDPDKLRNLAAWYREFAEQAGNPVIWESRLLMAESLELEAQRVDKCSHGRRRNSDGDF